MCKDKFYENDIESKLPTEEVDYRNKLIMFMAGLEVNNITEFINTSEPIDYLILGQEMAKLFKEYRRYQ
jgi:hypothetical protein